MTVATFEDRLFGVPLYADVSALFYNKDLFERAGLDPDKPPTSLEELRTYADAITALGGDIKGYYLPGNCAGCNIFTVGPLMWASGVQIEAATCGDEPLTGDNLTDVLQWLRDMAKSGNVAEGARSENGETFHLQFGSGNLGMMGTGNFNIILARDQMVGHEFEFGISLLPGLEPGEYASFIGGDLVVIPNGSERVDDAVAFMKFLLSDETQVEVYAKALQPDHPLGHGRQRVLQRRAARPGRGQGARGRPDAVHPDVLRADQLAAGPLAADAPAGLLHGRRPGDTVIADAKQQMKDISCA